MSTIALKRAADGVEAAKRKYNDARPRESIEPMLDMIRKARSKTPDPDQFDVVEKLHTTPDELWASVKGDKRAFRNELIRRVRDLRLFDALVSQWVSARCVKLGKPKSKRIESLERKAAKIQKQIARESEAITLIEKRFVARIARDTSMHELWRLTTAKLGKENDKSRATDHYSEVDLAKHKIALG